MVRAISRSISIFLVTLFSLIPLQIATAQGGSAYDLIAEVNTLRAANGMGPLATNSALMAAAQGHSEYMASQGSWSHTGSGGSTPGSRAAAAGYGGSVAENVAVVSSDASMTTVVNDIWSDGLHMNTMLNAQYSDIGVGVAVSGGQVYITLDVGGSGGISGSSGSALQVTLVNGTPYVNGTVYSAATRDVVKDILTSTPQPDGSVVHVVKAGEAPWSIAIAYGMKITEIVKLNNLPYPPVLQVGQKLLVKPSSTITIAPTLTKTPRPPTRTPLGTRNPKTQSTPKLTSQALETDEAPALSIFEQFDRRLLGIGIIIFCGAGVALMAYSGLRKK